MEDISVKRFATHEKFAQGVSFLRRIQDPITNLMLISRREKFRSQGVVCGGEDCVALTRANYGVPIGLCKNSRRCLFVVSNAMKLLHRQRQRRSGRRRFPQLFVCSKKVPTSSRQTLLRLTTPEPVPYPSHSKTMTSA